MMNYIPNVWCFFLNFNEYLLDKRVEKKHLGTAPYFSIHTELRYMCHLHLNARSL